MGRGGAHLDKKSVVIDFVQEKMNKVDKLSGMTGVRRALELDNGERE